jgi:uncharacterized protein DUF4177
VIEHKVVEIRATGLMPGVVAEEMERELNGAGKDGWSLRTVQPVIYNSATTGYFLLIFERPGLDD